MTYLAFISDPDNAVQVKYGVEGLGYEMDGENIVAFTTDERIANGTSSNPSDNAFLWTNFDFEADKLVENYQKSNPEVPADVVEGKIASQYSNYFDKKMIPEALASDEYVPNLQELIVNFVFKCMSAPEGQFDAVYEKEYQTLLDNHLQEVLDERAEWYDSNH